MNKEQFIDTLQACYFGDRGAFNKIVKEYEELHNKTDKAIEYINNNKCGTWYNVDKKTGLLTRHDNVLIEILKGDVDE